MSGTTKLLADNRRARYDYFAVSESLEVGIVLRRHSR